MTAPLTCRSVADRFNLRERRGRWRGTCPACQYGGSGTLSMNAARDGRPLLYCSNGCDQTALAAAIGAEPRVPDPAENASRKARALRMTTLAIRLFAGAESAPGTPAGRYLASRHLAHLATCLDLGFRADTPHPEAGKLPAMLALIRNASGEPVAVHRTFLLPDGNGKAAVEPAKASLGPFAGGAIRLGPVAAELAIGEGLETSAAAGVLTGLPAWAAISAGNLAKTMILPAEVRAVVIAVDRDPAGERAASAAAARWRAEGRTVRLLRPNLPGQDAADVLAARREDQAAMRAGFFDAERERLAGEVPHAP